MGGEGQISVASSQCVDARLPFRIISQWNARYGYKAKCIRLPHWARCECWLSRTWSYGAWRWSLDLRLRGTAYVGCVDPGGMLIPAGTLPLERDRDVVVFT